CAGAWRSTRGAAEAEGRHRRAAVETGAHGVAEEGGIVRDVRGAHRAGRTEELLVAPSGAPRVVRDEDAVEVLGPLPDEAVEVMDAVDVGRSGADHRRRFRASAGVASEEGTRSVRVTTGVALRLAGRGDVLPLVHRRQTLALD